MVATWMWTAADSSLCILIGFVSMVFYWRGLWDLYGVYISPDDSLLHNWAIFGLGCGTIFGYFLHPAVDRLMRDVSSRVVYVIVTRTYLYIFGLVKIAYFRGVWKLADLYLGVNDWRNALVEVLICYALLLCTKTSSSVIFPPLVALPDTRPTLLVPGTLLQTQVVWCSLRSVLKYILDSVLSHFVILTLVILSWRGSMRCIDVLMTSHIDDPVMSNSWSLVIGLVSTVMLFGVEPLLASVSYRLRNRRWLKLLWDDAVCTIAFVIETFLWRGGWNLNAMYVITDPLIGGWVNHCIGTFLLMSCQLLSCVGVCGCARDIPDATTAAESDVMFKTKYLRSFFSKQYEQSRQNSNIVSINSSVINSELNTIPTSTIAPTVREV